MPDELSKKPVSEFQQIIDEIASIEAQVQEPTISSELLKEESYTHRPYCETVFSGALEKTKQHDNHDRVNK